MLGRVPLCMATRGMLCPRRLIVVAPPPPEAVPEGLRERRDLQDMKDLAEILLRVIDGR